MRLRIIEMEGFGKAEINSPSLAYARKEAKRWGWGKIKIQKININGEIIETPAPRVKGKEKKHGKTGCL